MTMTVKSIQERLTKDPTAQPTRDEADFLLSLVNQEALPICPDCQQGYVCEHCGKPIGDYYANLSALESVSIQEQEAKQS